MLFNKKNVKKMKKPNEDLETQIYEVINKFPKSINDIAERIGIAYNTAYTYLLKLVIKRKISEKKISGVKTYFLENENDNWRNNFEFFR